ncbi:MAG: hypothetical protein ACT4P5_23680 [Armatimonadota bacterium]
MLETVIVVGLLFVVLAVATVTWSHRRLTRTRSRLIEHFGIAAPEITVLGSTDVGLTVRVLGTEVGVDLATLIRQRPRGSSEREWFDHMVAGLRARIPAPEVAPFALVQDRIVPQLKSSAYVDIFDQYPATQRLLWRAFAPGVTVTYVITGIHQLTAVTARSLQVWGISREALHELALANLRAQTRDMLTELGGPQRRYEHIDGLDASRILIADLVVPPEVTDPLLAIPEETVLLVAPASEEPGLASEAAARHGATSRPLSRSLFRLTDNGPVPIDA